ncbi:MAG: hypothetical protein ACD_63C00168G0005, partial [uncultured bacterium]
LFVFLSMFLVGTPFLLGYIVWTTRNVIRKEKNPLPEWSNYGDMAICGLKLWLCYFIYYLPLVVIILIPIFILFWISFMSGNMFYLAFIFGLYGLFLLLTLAYSLLFPSIYLRFVMTDDISETFKINEVFNFTKRNIGNVLLFIVFSWLAGMIASVGFIALFVGVFFTMFYAYCIQAHLMGQLQLEDKK